MMADDEPKLPACMKIAMAVIGFMIIVAGFYFTLSDRFGFSDKPPTMKDVPQPKIPGMIMLTQKGPARNAQAEEARIPFGTGKPTLVSVEYDGKKDTQVEIVTFHDFRTKKTPERKDVYGAVVSIPVNFEKRHFANDGKSCTLKFASPRGAKDGDYINFLVAIVRPEMVGTTLVGNFTIYYAGGKKPHTVKNVELDVLLKTPPKPEER